MSTCLEDNRFPSKHIDSQIVSETCGSGDSRTDAGTTGTVLLSVPFVRNRWLVERCGEAYVERPRWCGRDSGVFGVEKEDVRVVSSAGRGRSDMGAERTLLTTAIPKQN